MLNELFYGGTLASSVQSKLLLHLPDWFLTGASRFIGEGWLPEDEAYMRSLVKDKGSFAEKVMISDRVDRYPVLKKSIFYFVLNSYGRNKLVELFFMTRLTRNVQAGVNRVLGLSMQAFTLQWEEFIRAEFLGDRVSLLNETNLDFRPPAGARITGIDASPDGNSVAFYQEQDGVYQLKVYNFETGSVVNTPVRFGKKTDFDAYREINFPLTWSPDGSTIATTMLEQGSLNLVFYDHVAKKVTRFPLEDQLDWVASLSWGKAKQLLLVSGVQSGQTDLFLLKPNSPNLSRITRTPYDEINPAWSPDGERIFYASNAGDSVYTEQKKISYSQSRAGYDLYYLPYEFRGQQATRITFSPYGTERNLKLIGSTLFFVTSENGLENLASLDLSANNLEVSYLSNYGTGVSDFGGANNGRFLVRSLYDGRSRFYLIQRGDLLPIPFILKTRQAAAEYQLYLRALLEKAKELEKQELDSLRALGLDTLTATPADTNRTPRDTTRRRKTPPRFYIFDEAEDDDGANTGNPSGQPTTVGERTEPQRKRTTTSIASRKRPFSIDNVPVSRARPFRFGLDLRLIENLRFETDPILRDNFTAELELTDNRLYHRIRAGARIFFSLFSNVPSGTSNEWWVDYQWQRYRVQLEAGLSKESHQLEYVGIFTRSGDRLIEGRFFEFFNNENVDGQVAAIPPIYNRFLTYTGYIGAAYPINRYQKVYTRGKLVHATRIDQFDFPGDNLNEAIPTFDIRRFWGLTAGYTFDNTYYIQEYPLRGIRANAEVESFFNSDAIGPVYPQLKLSVHTYTPLVKDIVVAFRGQVGSSPAVKENRDASGNLLEYTRRYAIGGIPQWIAREGADFGFSGQPEGYHFLSILSGVRGFDYGTRVGRHYGLFTGEIRLPVRRIFNVGLNTRYLHNILLVGFVDAGVAWNEGNPFKRDVVSEQRTVDAGAPTFLVTVEEFKTPLIYSFGAGLRTPLLGYYLNLDVAAAFDDGERRPLRILFGIGRVF